MKEYTCISLLGGLLVDIILHDLLHFKNRGLHIALEQDVSSVRLRQVQVEQGAGLEQVVDREYGHDALGEEVDQRESPEHRPINEPLKFRLEAVGKSS